jgi:serine protease inhibitor ecotin
MTFNARQSAQKSGTREKAHRTVYRTCPVHHRTVRWARRLQLQRSESNGSVTWQAHRTVSGGAPDCLVRHATDNLPTATFCGWGYKYPNHLTFNSIQVFQLPTPYKSYSIQYKTHQRDQILSQVLSSFQIK